MIYSSDLYSQFSKLANKSIQLQIISGYASASFLKKVIKDFPHLKISLYIGMSDEGISLNNHLQFKEIHESNKAEIFYQSFKIGNARPTHSKVYMFFNNSYQTALIGSANFTENGFIKNREILIESTDDVNYLFDEQHIISIECTSDNIADYVNFYVEIDNAHEEESIISKIQVPDKKISEEDNVYSFSNIRNKITNHFKILDSVIDYEYHTFFKVQIAFNAESNYRWEYIGINGILQGEDSILRFSANGPLYNLFPENKLINIFTDDKRVLHARLINSYNRDLVLMNTTWYEFVINRLGIEYGVPLSNESLQQIRYSQFEFERISELDYLMWFSN